MPWKLLKIIVLSGFTSMRTMRILVKKIDQLNEWLGRIASWLLVPLVLVVCFDVVARKLFSFSRIWIMDLEWHLFAMLFLLAAGYTLKHNRHVRVDLFYDRFKSTDQGLVDLIGSLIFLLTWGIVVIIYSFDYAVQSFVMNEGASEPGGLPARYLIKFIIPLSVFMLSLQGLSLIYKSWTAFRKKESLLSDNSKTGNE